MGAIITRTIIIYISIAIAVRLMGKRQIGELQPMELVITMLLADFATVPLQHLHVPIIQGIIPVFMLMAIESILSFVALKIDPVRKMLYGAPNFVIDNGTINQKVLKKLHLTVEDLIVELRNAGAYQIEDVKYAIAETNGVWSVFLKPQNSPPTSKDMNITVPDPQMPKTLISDGVVKEQNITQLGKNEKWLYEQLSANKIKGPKDVLYMSCDNEEKIYIVKKEKGSKK